VRLGAIRLHFAASSCWKACLTLTETAGGISIAELELEDPRLLDSLSRKFAPYLDQARRKVVDRSEAIDKESYLVDSLPVGTYTAKLCLPEGDDCPYPDSPPLVVKEIKVLSGKVAKVYLRFSMGGPVKWETWYESKE
jgi:hypothetical protein